MGIASQAWLGAGFGGLFARKYGTQMRIVSFLPGDHLRRHGVAFYLRHIGVCDQWAAVNEE